MTWGARLAAALCAAVILSGCAGERMQKRLRVPHLPERVLRPRMRAEMPRSPQHRPEDFVLRERDFVTRSERLNVVGEDRVREMARTLPETSFSVILEPVVSQGSAETDAADDQLNRKRRAYVVERLLGLGVPDAESRVLVGRLEVIADPPEQAETAESESIAERLRQAARSTGDRWGWGSRPPAEPDPPGNEQVR